MDFYHIRLAGFESGMYCGSVRIGTLASQDWSLVIVRMDFWQVSMACWASQHGVLGVSFGVLPSQDWSLDMYQGGELHGVMSVNAV